MAEGLGAVVLAVLLLVVPWLVIALDVAALGFHLALVVAMLTVFSIGLMMLGAVGASER
jgi:hypothetical protein